MKDIGSNFLLREQRNILFVYAKKIVMGTSGFISLKKLQKLGFQFYTCIFLCN